MKSKKNTNMKLLAAIAVFAVVASVAMAIPDTQETHELFRSFMEEHGKTYSTVEEYGARFRIFQNNLVQIQGYNEQYAAEGVKFAVNQFADMTVEEFKSKILMSQPIVGFSDYCTGARTAKEDFEDTEFSALPDTWDWRDHNAVTSVKNQGSAGTCWAFSTAGNLEGQHALATGELVSLSEEQLSDCDPKDCGVFGGWPARAMEYIMEVGGLEGEATYPYCSGQGKCYPCPPPGFNETFCGPPPEYCNHTFDCHANKANFVAGLKDWRPISSNESAMQVELVKTGPLSVLIDATALQWYHSGVWNFPLCSKTELDHAVLLVGYGTEKSLLEEKPYWLVKNSWGEKWGEDGYFRMKRGDGKCGINTCVTTGIYAPPSK